MADTQKPAGSDEEIPKAPPAPEPDPQRYEVILPAYYTLADIRYPLPVVRVGDVVEEAWPGAEPDEDGDLLVKIFLGTSAERTEEIAAVTLRAIDN